MTAAVARVAQRNRQGIRRLPLQVEGVVEGVRKNIVLVVDAKSERRGAEGIPFLALPDTAVLAVCCVRFIWSGRSRHLVQLCLQCLRDDTRI